MGGPGAENLFGSLDSRMLGLSQELAKLAKHPYYGP